MSGQVGRRARCGSARSAGRHGRPAPAAPTAPAAAGHAESGPAESGPAESGPAEPGPAEPVPAESAGLARPECPAGLACQARRSWRAALAGQGPPGGLGLPGAPDGPAAPACAAWAAEQADVTQPPAAHLPAHPVSWRRCSSTFFPPVVPAQSRGDPHALRGPQPGGCRPRIRRGLGFRWPLRARGQQPELRPGGRQRYRQSERR
jgi:hypothetical protein